MVEGFFFFNESFRALELFLNDIGTPSKIFFWQRPMMMMIRRKVLSNTIESTLFLFNLEPIYIYIYVLPSYDSVLQIGCGISYGFTLNTAPIFFPVLQVPIITAALQAGAKAQDETDRDWGRKESFQPSRKLPFGKLTWQWKTDQLKIYSLLKMEIFHCQVSLLDGNLGGDF